MYRERVLFFCQELDDEFANQLIGIMLYLNAEASNKSLYIYINSPGGSVTCGIAVYDTMNYMKCGVSTICVGTAASMASFVLAGGDKGNRIALPHARIMIHQPEGGSKGQASEVLSESEEVLRIRRQVGRIYAEKTGQPLSRISRDLDRDQFLSAKEAKEYGLIDKIAVAS
jgi:ATP-dependent Clp protease, protease subunit